jgi:hypothetical protein
VVALAGCGDDGDPEVEAGGPPTTEAGPTAEWRAEEVAIERGADTELLTAVEGDQVVLLTASDEGVVQSAVATGDGPFETGPPLATGHEYLMLRDLVRHDGAWWAMGSGGTQPVPSRPDDWQLSFDLHVVTSPDGLTWTEVETTGLEGPAEITEVAATDDGLVAVGYDQTANLEQTGLEGGTFGPLAWRSDDGSAWEPVDLAGGEWGPSALVTVDDGLLAIGGGEDEGTVAWRSDEGGRSWTEATLEGLDGVRLQDVVPFGDGLLASGSAAGDDEGSTALATSGDGGRTWTAVGAPPLESPEGPGSLFAAGDRVFTLMSDFFDPGADPLACYADIAQCQGDAGAVLYEGDGQGAWSRIDLAALDLGEYEDVHGVVATEDRLLLWSAGEEAVRTWSTAADATLPTEPEPTTETADLPTLDAGEEPEVGVRYAQPLSTHCGMDWLYLGEEPWQRTDDGEDVSDGGMIYGYATLGEDGTVTYEDADGEVIATYGPPTREPEMCM